MDPKLKSTIWTVLTIIVLLIFFIVNNTRTEPEEGPYPPNYTPTKKLSE
jgi:putative exporter of polyketide antibiotics